MLPSLEILDEISQCTKNLRNYFEAIHLENERLIAENTKLLARTKMNSTNSSKPPSSNPFIKPKSLRVKTGRKPGGQLGHKGYTLRIKKTAQVEVEHKVDICIHCGCDISKQDHTIRQTRQVIDVQLIPYVTNHHVHSKTCLECGKETTAVFPQGVDHYIQYGNTFSSIIVCLNKGNYIPYDRLSKISKDILGIPVSSGTLVNIVHECGKSLKDSMSYIKDQLKKANVVHFDETGTRINGKNHWLHSAGNKQFTYLETHAKRGSIATNDIGILPAFKGTAIHDFWKSYFNDINCKHALCNSHILRELTGIIENFKQTWAEQMKTLLVEIKRDVEVASEVLTPSQISDFEIRYNEILNLGDKENPIDKDVLIKRNKRGRVARSKAQNLLDRMKLYKKDILKFMVDFEIPFDNNLAERDIRMSKLYQKISGGFRSDDGNEVFDSIRSYISTASKQGLSMFESVHAAVSGNPLFTDESH